MKTLPRILLLSAAVSLALTACNREAGEAGTGAPKALSLDESRLPPVNRFRVEDLDTTKDACNDFGGYANAKFLAVNPVPADRTSWGAFEMLDERSTAVQQQLAEQAAADAAATGVEKIIGDFWATGMDEAKINAQGIAPLADTLASIDAISDTAGLAAWLRETAARGQGFLLGIGSMPDFQNPSINIAVTAQSGFGLPDTPYYTDPAKQDIRDAYVAHVAKVLELSGVPAGAAAEQAKQVLAFETRLAKVSKSRAEFSRDVSLYYNPMSVEEADALTPNFSWTEFFAAQGIPKPEVFSVSVPDFFREVNRMFEDVPLEQWKAYLRFHVVDGASPYLSDDFARQHYEFHNRTLAGQKEMKPRWKRVLGTINRQVGEAMGQLYVQVAFPPESKQKMEALVANLGEALKARIENLEWMSDETKTRALEKLATFEPRIGYPDKWRDWTGLATGRDSYLGNVLAAMEFNYKWDISKIGQPVDRSEWGMHPQTVNASYNPLTNQLTFPAAILQPPFFDPHADDAVNYGAIGAVIGHEIGHGFDDQGRKFAADGSLTDWWTEADSAAFGERAKKLIVQYSQFEALPGLKVNGAITIGENIGDLGGLNMALHAYKLSLGGKEPPVIDGLTGVQRFFLSWAQVWRSKYRDEAIRMQVLSDPHSPAPFRVNGAVRNMDEWYEAFDVQPTDKLYLPPEERVRIW